MATLLLGDPEYQQYLIHIITVDSIPSVSFRTGWTLDPLRALDTARPSEAPQRTTCVVWLLEASWCRASPV